jgi:hypothetical protein
MLQSAIMNVRGAVESECVQCLNRIYAWSRLLERSSDATLIAQAAQSIQTNVESLLRRLGTMPEVI